MKNIKLIDFLAQACYYAQEHIDDADAWGIDKVNRENLLQCTSFQVACFLFQNTVYGNQGVGWDVVIAQLVEHPAKTIEQWKIIIAELAKQCGGWKK